MCVLSVGVRKWVRGEREKERERETFNPLSAKVAKLRQDVILHKIDCSS